MIQSIIEYIVKELVDKPDRVIITLKKLDSKTNVEIFVDEIDRGKVIGKDGQTIKALRTLITSLMPADKKVMVDLVS